ncbi:MAG: hypothetical protein FWG49_07280, partial [Leptospirales bacterium]|nr:hypothetical protein [Leptospirales bacterium]
MFRIFLIYSSAIIVTTASIYYAVGQNNSVSDEKMTQSLKQEAEENRSIEKIVYDSSIFLPDDEDSDTFFKKDEWVEYVTDPQYNEHIARGVKEGNIYSDDTVNINALGSIQLNLKYGESFFTDSKYKQYDEDKPESRVIASGFLPEQIIQLHMDGAVGDRITVFIDHDSRRKENRYIMNYRAVYDNEVIREINVGEIDIKFNHSKYAVYDNTEAKGLGADFTIRKNNLLFKAFGSVARGETAVEYFRGNSSPGETAILDYQYIRGTYYQLEPFIRYDGIDSTQSLSWYPLSITMTSDLSSRDPIKYTLSPVNISPSGFDIYIDDQNPYTNNNAIQLSLDGGYYKKMVNGSDYTINFITGVIKFLRNIPENSRIFAVYNRTGGTRDPCALSSGPHLSPLGPDFSNRIFVFIKYGYSINEDTIPLDYKNGGRGIILDAYEIRSVYSLGAKNIISSDFSLNFYEDNHIMQKEDISKLGKYRLDLVDGVISFYTREPYKTFLKQNAPKIYNEIKISDAYLYSRYKMSSAYYSEARYFKLKHDNLIENSVRVKVDENDLSQSLYSVDHESGFVSFSNFDNPVISSDTRIEIKYEYLPFGATAEKFIGGLRADYDINKSLRIGGSVLLSRDGKMDVIPDVGKEGEQTLMVEGDASLKLNSKRIADIYNIFAEKKKKSIPLEFSAYAEYAKSYTDTNTFGKALVDNMEKPEEIINVSLSEKDWILSSMPAPYRQAADKGQDKRGVLYYKYYRSLDSLGTLRGEGFTPHKIDYSVKPGPYNIAMGPIDNNDILEQGQQ